MTIYSEFGLIVAAIAATSGLVSNAWLVVISLALAGSFVLAAPLNAASERIYTRLKQPLAGLKFGTLMAADRPVAIAQVDAAVLGLGHVGSGAFLRLTETHGLRVLGVDNDAARLAPHLAAQRRVIEGGAVDSDIWHELVITDCVKQVLLAMPGHAGNVYALQQLRKRAFAGHIAAIVDYPEEVDVQRELGADAAFHIYAEAGTAFADDALAGAKRLAGALKGA